MVIDKLSLPDVLNQNICFSLAAIPQVVMQGKLLDVEIHGNGTNVMILETGGDQWKARWDMCSMVWLND